MAGKIYSTRLQDFLERNIFALILMTGLVVSIGGIVEIVPLFYLEDTLEDRQKNPDGTLKNPELQGIRPYTGLELAGRDIYLREGCYTCHSQMIRPFRDEKERYGHYSLAAESQYDHPFQWGSKRTGPDLARVGGKYSDEWQIQHLMDPRSVVPESVMPRYPWFATNTIDGKDVTKSMQAMRAVGVPYTDEEIDAAFEAFDGKTEMEAMVAYLQMLGTLVKFDEGKDYRE
ncbi:cytochrome-c oxidase, cbb3-type subunit II [Pelagibaculum spongiae]|uniref:Cytochrome-c oxidase, cbb3-type subunit II n=1 Tax=Pelagibaculum spongiae TaxID=2080658 RepID=A0A2V1GYA8_9GAMM|nr:cytochrome-c oxidase, cbb3-type subunit II [Pelagibaculum spongiae]PVZ70317.1 cytochrome-c oxidase, cbb3-type subunit II [Pelagibaculum spongiae]